MKNTKLESLLIVCLIMVMLIGFHACSDESVTERHVTKESLDHQLTNQAQPATSEQKNFTTTIGAPIPWQTGEQWIENYKRCNRKPNPTFRLPAQIAKEILSNYQCVGISFLYGQDEYRNLDVIPIGVDIFGKLIRSEWVYSNSGYVSWTTAQQRIATYQGSIYSHFFGANTFTRLFDQKINILKLTLALDDYGRPQLLLSNALQSRSPYYEDGSGPCPPVCPQP